MKRFGILRNENESSIVLTKIRCSPAHGLASLATEQWLNDMLSISLAGGLGALVEYRMKKDQKRFGMIRKKMISPLVPN